MDSPGPLLYLSIVFLLVISALFSASETAISTVNRLRLKKFAEKGSKKAKAALAIIEQYDKALYTILVGNNVVNIASSAIATIIFTALVGNAGPAVATVVMTILVLTFGEILPKSYGKDHNEKVILNLSRLLRGIMILFTPITWVFMKLKDKVAPAPDEGPSVTEEDLHYLMDSVEEEGVIEEYERDLVQSALEFDDIGIRDILTPRVNMVALDVQDEPDAILETILEEGYARIPVYEESIDNIIGVLYTREYLRCIIEGSQPDLRELLAKPFFVHRSMKLSELLAFFKSKKVNLAVVTDDYGGTLGLVTTEDVIEELVGELWDEDEEDEPEGFVQLDANTCEVLGSYYMRDLLEEQEWEDAGYEIEGDYNTVNGWAMHIFEHIPQEGESALYKDLLITVLEMDGNRINILKITKKAPDSSKESVED